jgi:hypothetical protein
VRSSLLLVGLAVAAFMGAPGRSAHAAGLPILVVHRTEDVADCPDARALAHRVAEQMKRPALVPAVEVPAGAEPGLDVQIYKSDQGFTAVIQAGGRTRQLSDKGTTCGGLAVALAVSIAVLLDTEPLTPAPDPPSPSAVPPAGSPALPLPPEATPLPPPVEDRPVVPRLVRVTLAASPVLTVGLLQGFAGGVSTELEVRVGRFTVSGGVLALPGESIILPGGQVKLELTAGLVRACGIVAGDEPMRLVLCAEPMGGSMHGEGQGYPASRPSNLPWAAVATSALFQQRIWGPVAWGARAGLAIPLTKNSFAVENGPTVFTAAPVGGVWNAELRVSIW